MFSLAARNDTLLLGLGLDTRIGDLRIGEVGIAFGLRIEVGGIGLES